MRYQMFSDDALAKFQIFTDAAGFTRPPNPAGAFDEALKMPAIRKDPKMKFRFVPLAHCDNQLFLRQKSSDLAFDEATEISDPAKKILEFLRGKISDEDLKQVEESLKAEAGVKVDSTKKAEAMIAGAEARGATAQDSRCVATCSLEEFHSRFPGSKHIGHV